MRNSQVYFCEEAVAIARTAVAASMVCTARPAFAPSPTKQHTAAHAVLYRAQRSCQCTVLRAAWSIHVVVPLCSGAACADEVEASKVLGQTKMQQQEKGRLPRWAKAVFGSAYTWMVSRGLGHVA